MSAPTLKLSKPHGRLQRLVTLDRLATAVTWVFWLFAVGTALQFIVAVSRGGVLFAPTQDFPPGPLLRVWVSIAPPLLPHAGNVPIHSGLAHGVQASWNGAIVGTAHPRAGQALAFAVTLLPDGLLRVGTLYLVMRLARTAARDGIYTVRAARLVLFLGWWLLAGGLVAGLAGGFARLNLLSLLVTWHVDWVHWPASWAGWGTVEWFGLGLIIFARIMRVSARMRADLEGTV
jgi:hypothetical protein